MPYFLLTKLKKRGHIIPGGVAQWLEQSAHNRLVVGSIPTTPTKNLVTLIFLYRKQITNNNSNYRCNTANN